MKTNVNMVSSNNYFINTFAIFKKVAKSRIKINRIERTPDYISYFKFFDEETGKIIETINVSSKYYYTKKGVYRLSDHWGGVGSCYWGLNKNTEENTFVLGYAKWDSFLHIIQYKTKDILTSYEEYNGIELPVIPENLIGKNNVAYEFRGLQLATCKYDHPLDDHPNHISPIVNIVEGLEWRRNFGIERVY